MWIRIGIIALALAALAGLWISGGHEHATPENLRALVARAGPFGPPLFIVLFAVAELFYVPPALFLLGAPLIWRLEVAVPTAYFGSVASAITVFFAARYVVNDDMRESIRRRLPERMRRFDDGLATRGLRTVILVRLLLFMMPLTHWVLGISRVSARDAVLGTAIGLLPGVVFWVVAGEAIIANWETAQPWVLAAVVLSLAIPLLRRIRARRRGHAP